MTSADTLPLVLADGASKTFGSGHCAVVAVHDLGGAVMPGDRIAVTGPPGSGKSVLLHLLAGLERPTTGTVYWPGLTARRAGPARDIGLVFQRANLVPSLSVVENAALPLVLRGVGDVTARQRANDALLELDLDAVADRLPAEITRDQAQRVAVARVRALRPRLIIADEPTGQLDQRCAEHIVDVLLAASDHVAGALVVATHDLAVVRRMSTRWLVRDGTVLAMTSASGAPS